MKLQAAHRFSLGLWLFAVTPLSAFSAQATETGNRLEIQSVSVDDKSLRWQPGGELRLGAFPKNVVFGFNRTLAAGAKPLRLRYKLDGYDKDWDTGGGFMFVMIRFYNAAGEPVSLKNFPVEGESPGWNGSLDNSSLAHRRETLTVPPNATRLWAIISSAGPPSTMGIYVIDNLVVSRLSATNAKAQVLLGSPFADNPGETSTNRAPPGWVRDGTQNKMARIVELGHDPQTKALAIVDEDPLGHAEWHNTWEVAPRVQPGDNLVVEWNEMFSIGECHGQSHNSSRTYAKLPPGHYQFRVGELTVMGQPTGHEPLLNFQVSRPYWELPWFWAVVAAFTVAGIASAVRYLARHRIQQAMARLDQQRMLEQERVRIAQDIHDDLGARVTQISLVSGLAENDVTLSGKARDEFHRISFMSRDLVSSLYETVWAVNPENDNLRAVGNYLCQAITELCAQAQLRCRLNVPPLPRQIEVSSRVRHNLSMATREAVHNVVKHARASQVTVFITLVGRILTITIQDDGCGFKPSEAHPGHGLVNMQRRLEGVGGSCQIESAPGKGTTVLLKLALDSAAGNLSVNQARQYSPMTSEAPTEKAD